MTTIDSSARARACIVSASSLAETLGAHALLNGASEEDALRVCHLAERIWPIVIWQISHGEIAPTAEGLADTARIFSPGAAITALRSRVIPIEVRQPLLNVLQPTRSGNPELLWWDDHAIPTWVAPFCASQEASGELQAALRVLA
jgi:hypothetical protein